MSNRHLQTLRVVGTVKKHPRHESKQIAEMFGGFVERQTEIFYYHTYSMYITL